MVTAADAWLSGGPDRLDGLFRFADDCELIARQYRRERTMSAEQERRILEELGQIAAVAGIPAPVDEEVGALVVEWFPPTIR